MCSYSISFMVGQAIRLPGRLFYASRSTVEASSIPSNMVVFGLMKKVGRVSTIVWLGLLPLLLAQTPAAVEKAAAKYIPGMTWKTQSLISADFTCRGRKEQAILGFSSSEIVIAVFAKGLQARPEVVRFSAKDRDADTVELTVEDLDFDPREDGYELEGFQPSKSCRGLNLADGERDSAHIYWNRKKQQFYYWTL